MKLGFIKFSLKALQMKIAIDKLQKEYEKATDEKDKEKIKQHAIKLIDDLEKDLNVIKNQYKTRYKSEELQYLAIAENIIEETKKNILNLK